MQKAPRKMPPAQDAHRAIAGKKSTKRWCFGKVGREHTPICMYWKNQPPRYPNEAFAAWREFVCTGCGKRIAYYAPMNILMIDGRGALIPIPDRYPKPTWVTF